MADRRGEKIGWTIGWFGGFLWLLVLSIVFVVQGKMLQALLGIILFGMAAVCILYFSPWRHPSTPYWRLMIAPYVLIFVSVAWALGSFGVMKASGFSGWTLFCFLPLLIPFMTFGKRTWKDFEALSRGNQN